MSRVAANAQKPASLPISSSSVNAQGSPEGCLSARAPRSVEKPSFFESFLGVGGSTVGGSVGANINISAAAAAGNNGERSKRRHSSASGYLSGTRVGDLEKPEGGSIWTAGAPSVSGGSNAEDGTPLNGPKQQQQRQQQKQIKEEEQEEGFFQTLRRKIFEPDSFVKDQTEEQTSVAVASATKGKSAGIEGRLEAADSENRQSSLPSASAAREATSAPAPALGASSEMLAAVRFTPIKPPASKSDCNSNNDVEKSAVGDDAEIEDEGVEEDRQRSRAEIVASSTLSGQTTAPSSSWRSANSSGSSRVEAIGTASYSPIAAAATTTTTSTTTIRPAYGGAYGPRQRQSQSSASPPDHPDAGAGVSRRSVDGFAERSTRASTSVVPSGKTRNTHAEAEEAAAKFGLVRMAFGGSLTG